jgi:hypothetical protein
MTVGTVIVVVMVIVMWVLALTSWRLRNWRATAILGAASAAVLGVGMLPAAVASWLQGAALVVLFEVLFVRGGLLSIAGGPVDSFIEEYLGLLQQLADLKRRTRNEDPTEYIASFATIIDGLEKLRPPSTESADLNDDTIRELNRRLVLLKLGTRPSPVVFARTDVEWAEIEQRFERLQRGRSGFWADWPRFFSRSDKGSP